MTTESGAHNAASARVDSDTPVSWDIRGFQNNWNWKLSLDADEIVYQTRFPSSDVALVYRGAGTSVPLLAGIMFDEDNWRADITFLESLHGNVTLISDPTTMENIAIMIERSSFAALEGTYRITDTVRMENIAEEAFSNRWSVNVRALGGRELHWEYQHPVDGNNSMYLTDPVTGNILGDGNDNYLALHEVFSKDAVEELAITGTAALILLSGLMHNDMTIAVQGPNGHDNWKYQELDWWEREADGVNEKKGERID